MSNLSNKTNIKNKRKRINFKSKKKLNSVLIQNDKIWVIFWHFVTILRV